MQRRLGPVWGLVLGVTVVVPALPGLAPGAAAQPAVVRGVAPAPAVLPLLPVDPAATSPLPPRQRVLLVRDLSVPALGPGVAALVSDVGSPQLARTPAAVGIPASTLKLLTATGALQLLDPAARLTTSVVLAPAASTAGGDQGSTGQTTGPGGAPPDRIVLVGGGDATLQTRDAPDAPGGPSFWRPATLTDLARRTATALSDRQVRRVTLGYDDSLFTGPSVAPSWEAEYVSTGVVAPVTALMVDEGLADPASGSLARVANPAREAADRFARLLKARGITVVREVSAVPRSFDAGGRAVLAAVQSPPVTWLVERMLTDSDNQLAESVARLVALADGRPGSFAGAGAALRRVAAAAAGAPATRAIRVDDGSGLSRDDRLSPVVLVALLRQAVGDPSLRTLLTSLPVAAFTGTLADRYRSGPSRQGAGVVRAKTGTLTQVDAQAGLAVDGSGGLRLFAFLADATNGDVTASRDALDAAASRLVP